MDVRHQAMSSLTTGTGTGPVLVLLFFFLHALVYFSIAADTLNPDQRLADGQTLVSNGGNFVLGFFSPGNSLNRHVGIWYNKVSVPTVVWVANRQTPITGTTGILSISGNGSLVITDANSNVVWSTAAVGTTSPVARLLDDGNFVVTSTGGGGFVWQSFDHPTDTLLPGMKLGWDLKTGLNRNLTAWTSDSDPSPGIYTMAMDVRGDPQIFLWAGSSLSWRTGPWDGLRFSGIPDMQTYSMFTFDFVSNSDEVYYSFNIRNPTVISRLIVNQSGQTQRLVWLDTSRLWNVFWFAPKDQCDTLSPCGPNGVCDPNNSPICSCLQGFQPKSPADWALRDGTDGCVRRTALDCRNRTDGFVTVAGAKLPDTSSATVDMNMSLDQCEVACLNNCSCRAYASANISAGPAGSGCIIWTADLADLRVYTFAGDDLYVRLAAADLGSTSNQSRKRNIEAIGIILGGVLGGLLFICIGYYIWNKKKKKKTRQAIPTTTSFNENYTEESVHGKEMELPLFDLDTIIAAINNFSNQNKIGEGGFGPVYKGKLGDGQEIAVKRLAKTSVQGLDEFMNEVMLIVKLQHRNLVRLLGCCIQGEERLLIYEYMPNRSLDAFLFDKMQCATLDWQTRYKIIIGIARGLVYLHQDSRFRIIHRDLKASNILLDADMNPKISDFGMARIFGGDEAEVNTRKVVGTYGYMSPEYAMDGIFSVKSDVFSFGVLVLEIISGKKNRGVYLSGLHQNLLGHAWSLWKEGNALELVDESMTHSFSMTEALKCIKVGLLCVQERPEDRPTMSSVVLLLGSERAVLPAPKQPGFVAKRSPFEMDSSTSKQDSSTLNEISVTMVEGR